jgi:hypothetical protein
MVKSWLAAWTDEPLTMTFPLPIREAEERLGGFLRGPVQATPYGVYQVTGFGANRGVRLAARPDSLWNPWFTQLSARLEADGFQTRLTGRFGAPWSAKLFTAFWTTVLLLVLLAGVATGVAHRSAADVAESIGFSLLGLVIPHGFVVAGGRSRPGEIAYLKHWLAERLRLSPH